MLQTTVNPGTRSARYLALFTPSGTEGYFAERGTLTDVGDGNPDPTQIEASRISCDMVFADEQPQ